MQSFKCGFKRILVGLWGTFAIGGCFAAPIKLDLYTQDFPPLQVELQGKPEGYVVKFVEAVVADASKTLPMEIEDVHFVPWKRAIRTTQRQSNVLFFSVSRTKQRENQYAWIGEVSPYDIAIYRHKSGPNVALNRLSDLQGYCVASQPESAFDGLLKRNGKIDVIPVSYGKQAIKLLHANRVDFAPLAQASYHYRLEQYGFSPSDFVEVMKVEELSKELWLVTGKKTSPEVIKALKESFQRLKARGVLEELIEEYHPDSEEMRLYRKHMV